MGEVSSKPLDIVVHAATMQAMEAYRRASIVALATADAGAEAAKAVAPLIAVDIDERHRTTIAHSLVGMAEGASRLLVERGDEFDPDAIAQVVADLAWAGLRAVQPKD